MDSSGYRLEINGYAWDILAVSLKISRDIQMISNNIPKRYPKHIQKISECMDIVRYLWIILDILGYPNGANPPMNAGVPEVLHDSE
jgi:hypothetical protein